MANREIEQASITPWLDEAEELADDMPGAWSDGVKRRFASRIVPAYRAHVEQQQRKAYEPVAARAASEYADILIPGANELGAVIEQIQEDLRDGSITAAEARREVEAVKRDLDRCAADAESVRKSEESAWDVANLPAPEFQRRMAARMPALFQGGRGRPQITEAHLQGKAPLRF